MGKSIIVLVCVALLITACNLPVSPSSLAVQPESKYWAAANQVALCYKGPDPGFGVAASLDPNLQLSLVGASSDGSYAVIKDPANLGGICWVDLRDIKIGSEDLLAEFLRLGVENPDSSESDSVYLSPIFVELHPPSTNCEERQKEGEGDEGGSVYACHSQAEFDYYCAECGEWVYPAYVIPSDCDQNSACVTPTPLPPVFMACTPTSPQSGGWSAEVATDPTPTFGDWGAAVAEATPTYAPWGAEVASDPTPTFGTWSAEIAASPTPIHIPLIVSDVTLCWDGPGPGYEVISALQPYTTVEVIGIGEGGGYIVITNPVYNLPCWVKETDVDAAGLDLSQLQIFAIPLKPAAAEETPVMGCMVAENMTEAPKCIAPCPDPVKYSVACTP